MQSPAPAPTEEPAAADRGRRMVLLATILASAMAFIDGSVVTIVLPILQHDLDTGISALQWVVNGYTLFLGALILVGGAAGDRFGRRRVFVIGTVGFALGSAACALAPSVGWLIAARCVKGVGAALMVPQSLAILSYAYPPRLRGKAIGTWAAASAVTTAVGPAVGGILIDATGWRAAFWINLPLALVVLWLTHRHVPESRSEHATGPLDWTGAALAVGASALLTLGLTGFAEGWAHVLSVALMLAGCAGWVAFVAVERRAPAPLVPLGLFRSSAFSGANLMTLFLYGALAGMLFLLPFEMLGPRGMSASEVGLLLLPLGLIIAVVARPAGALADRRGVRPLLVTGSALTAVAGAALAFSPPGLVGAILPVALLAFGMALVVAPLTTAVMNAAPDALAGAASGVSNAASRLAGLFAVALVAAIAAGVFATRAPGARFGVWPAVGSPDYAEVAAAFRLAYASGMAASAAMAAAAALVAWATLPKGRLKPWKNPAPPT